MTVARWHNTGWHSELLAGFAGCLDVAETFTMSLKLSAFAGDSLMPPS